MLADELHRDRAAAAVGNVGELLGAGQLLQRHRDDLVFLLGAGAAHLEGLVVAGLDRLDVVLGRLVGRVGGHPQDELVERQHGDRRQVLPAEGHAGARSGVVNRLDSVMMILCGSPGALLDLEEAFGAGAAALVDGDHRLLHQVVLGDDALDEARHLVGAAAGAGRDDELHGLGRLPACAAAGRRRQARQRRQRHGSQCRPNRARRCLTLLLLHCFLLGCLLVLARLCGSLSLAIDCGGTRRGRRRLAARRLGLCHEPGDQRPEQQDHAQRHDRADQPVRPEDRQAALASPASPGGTIPRPCRRARSPAPAAAADSRAC